MNTAQGEDFASSWSGPEHAGLLATSPNDGFAARFNDARADEKALATKRTVAHPFAVMNKVMERFFHGLRVSNGRSTGSLDDFLYSVLEEKFDPTASLFLVLGIGFTPKQS